MARQIFIVDAVILDANGTYNHLTEYPKAFDSKNYQGDIDKAKKRAEGDMSEVWGAMCKRDDRLMQAVTLATADGFQIDRKCMGQVVEVAPTPAPEPEPEEETEPEEEAESVG